MNKVNKFKEALKVYRNVLWAIVIFSAAINLLLFVGPLYMMQVYDRVLQSRNETTLVMITLIAVGLLILHAFLEYVRSRVLVRAGYQFDEQVSEPLFHLVVKGSLMQPGAPLQNQLGDVNRLREFLTGSGLIAFCDVPWTPVFLIVCFIFHPLLGWVSLGGAAVIFVLAMINEIATKKWLNEAQNLQISANNFATTTLQNVEAIRALGMERPLRGRWLDRQRQMIDFQAVASDKAGGINAVSKFVRMAMQVAILGVGAYLALAREISPGMMIAASIMMGRALAPVDQVVGQWKSFVGARQSYARLVKLFESVPPDETKTDLPALKGKLSVEQLMAALPNTRTAVLQGVSFAINPGECLAIVGPSGAGKSSLMRILVGVWPIASGAVRYDGSEIVHWNPEELGRNLGYLPQDVELFAGTVAENIARFQDATDESILDAAQKAGVHELIQGLKNGYGTQIGVGGSQLSGGQRQRIGYARALFGDPAVVLLDEPNSNLDAEGEAGLIRSIQQLKAAGKTVIFVSHKLNLLALSDKTLVLQDGKVKAFGPTSQIFQPQAAPNPAVAQHPNAVARPMTAGTA